LVPHRLQDFRITSDRTDSEELQSTSPKTSDNNPTDKG
jgi:hypothetical protein